MTLQIALALGITVITVVLFVTEKLRMDAVALLVLCALAVVGLVTTEQALSGFSNQATITVGAMFILAAGLESSGALSGVGRLLSKAKTPTTFLLLLFAVLAVIAPFVNNTAVVAVFMPIVIAATANIGMSASKALIPLSYVSQMAGVCTLVGTSTNLLVNSMARDMGEPGFSMFEFTPLGLICMGVGCLYLLTIGRWLLPDTSTQDDQESSDFGKYMSELLVEADSPLIGQTAEEAKLGEEHGIFVLDLLRGPEKLASPRSQEMQEGDILIARGSWEQLSALREKMGLRFHPLVQTTQRIGRIRQKQGKDDEDESKDDERVVSEVMIAPNSRAQGYSLAQLSPNLRHDAIVLGMLRRGQVLRQRLRDVPMQVGDILLMFTTASEMAVLRKDKNLLVLSQREAREKASWRAPFSLAVMVAVIAVAVVGWLPIAISSLIGAVAMTIAGCVSGDEVYDTVDWRTLMLLAGLMPLGIAMSESGAAEFLVNNTLGLVKHLGPHVVLSVMYLMALMLAEFMSNAAAAVLLTPVGVSTAHMLGVDATPFLIAVTFAASTSFATPVGYQTNTMVYTAGGYRFTDFVKVGLPLNLIFWGLGSFFIPIFWPF